jgi:hypothetical protein
MATLKEGRGPQCGWIWPSISALSSCAAAGLCGVRRCDPDALVPAFPTRRAAHRDRAKCIGSRGNHSAPRAHGWCFVAQSVRRHCSRSFVRGRLATSSERNVDVRHHHNPRTTRQSGLCRGEPGHPRYQHARSTGSRYLGVQPPAPAVVLLTVAATPIASRSIASRRLNRPPRLEMSAATSGLITPNTAPPRPSSTWTGIIHIGSVTPPAASPAPATRRTPRAAHLAPALPCRRSVPAKHDSRRAGDLT